MPYRDQREDLPTTQEDLQERTFEAYLAGMKKGREQGGKEIAGKVQSWVKNRYMDKGVKRKTPLAEGILDLVRDLSLALKGDLGKVDENPSETQSKERELLRLELFERGEL